MNIALIALDLDDTLLSPDLSISTENAHAVREAARLGCIIVLASGRHYVSMRRYAQELGLVGLSWPMVCMNGAEVRDTDSGRVLMRTELDPGACKQVLAVLSAHGFPAQAYEDDRILVSEHNSWTEQDSRLTGAKAVLASMEELASKSRVKFVASAQPELIQKKQNDVQAALAGIARVVVSKPYFMEILPIGADKATGLAWAASMLGIERDAVMAIGDSGNDLEMVAWAAYGCAPSDARADVLEAARFVSSLPHDKDAVAELIDRLVLSQP